MPEQPLAGQSPCPCGSGHSYNSCCQHFHLGEPAPTPETLMRSRYCAFVLGRAQYLLDTWHASTRPKTLSLDGSPDWASLRILDSSDSGDAGKVHFMATYRVGNGWGYLEETSDFIHEQGRWFYLAGKTNEGQLKPGRNDVCPCGSGKKYKACCL